MNKTPIITIIALLMVVLFVFSGCEFEISLNGESNTETSVETIIVTDEEGSTRVETTVHYVTTEPVPVVTIVEVTNEKGKVVETEKVTLSPEEVQQGKDFFGAEETTKKASKEPAADKNTTEPTTQATTRPAQDDLAVLNSSKYLIEGRVVSPDGTSYPYKMARDGSRFTFRTVYESDEICLIVGHEYVYLVSPSKKSYAKVAKELVSEDSENAEEFEDLLSGDAFNLYANKTVVDTYTEKMYGVKYKVVEYDDGTLDYFNGKTLVQTVSTNGATLYYDVISTNVSEGLFVPPAGYTEDLLSETLTTTEATTK